MREEYCSSAGEVVGRGDWCQHRDACGQQGCVLRGGCARRVIEPGRVRRRGARPAAVGRAHAHGQGDGAPLLRCCAFACMHGRHAERFKPENFSLIWNCASSRKLKMRCMAGPHSACMRVGLIKKGCCPACMQDQRAFSSHTDWIVAAAWHPTSQHHIATASYDHSVKLWDLRAAIPLHTLAAHADKALCVAWAGPAQLVSGGADCELRTYSVQL